MIRLSVCVEMFWTALPFPDRMRRVKALGLAAYEFWRWKNKDLDALRAAQDQTGLALAAMSFQADLALVQPGRAAVLLKGLTDSARAARSLNCSKLIITSGNAPSGASFRAVRGRVVDRLKTLARVAEDEQVTLLLEPLNPIIDHKGCWLTRTEDAVAIVEEVASDRVRILYDIYHQQITEGNLIRTIGQNLRWIGHFHAAGVPGRGELVGGELDYGTIFAEIGRAGYDGCVGLEFSPTRGEEAALREAMRLAGA